MPELRPNFFTKEWAIIATERADRTRQCGITTMTGTACFVTRWSGK